MSLCAARGTDRGTDAAPARRLAAHLRGRRGRGLWIEPDHRDVTVERSPMSTVRCDLYTGAPRARRTVGPVAYVPPCRTDPDLHAHPDPAGARRPDPGARRRAARGAVRSRLADGRRRDGERRRGAPQHPPAPHGHRLPRVGRTVVLIPAAFSHAEERRWVAQMVAELQTREDRRRRSLGGDAALMARADRLRRPISTAAPTRQRPVGRQPAARAGARAPRPTAASGCRAGSGRCPTTSSTTCSCTSSRTCSSPATTTRFWALVARYPRTERARGFLEGVELRVDRRRSAAAEGARPTVD